MKTAEQRRAGSNAKIKELGIACCEWLPLLDIAEFQPKNQEAVSRRAVACLLSTQLACDINSGEGEQGREFFGGLVDKFGVRGDLLAKEQRLFAGDCSAQDVIDVVWTYEAYWALVWALGLVDELDFPREIVDVERAVRLVAECESLAEFQAGCRLRDPEDILDALDLYYRYHWACVEKQLVPATEIGELNPDVVVERRRALEWLMCELPDWEDVPMDT